MEQEPWKALLDKWREASIAILDGLGDEEITSFERRFGLQLPRTFRRYLRTANGMAPGDWDADLIHFWSLDEIARELSEPGALDRYPFVPFADYSIECWVWVLPLTPNRDLSDAVHTYGPPLHPCAPSFPEFIDRYTRGVDLSPSALEPGLVHWKNAER